NGQLFEFDQGTTLTVPRPGGAAGPQQAGNPIANNHSFTVNDGIKTVQFVFVLNCDPTNPPAHQSNQVLVFINSTDTPQQVAAKFAAAVNGAVATQAAGPGQLTNIHAVTEDSPNYGKLLGYGQVRIIGTGNFVPAVTNIAAELTSAQALHGGIPVPFAGGYSANQMAQAIGTAVTGAKSIGGASLGYSATYNGNSVTFQNADSLVPNPEGAYANPNNANVFSFGTDALPIGLQNNFYTSDYARLGMDVHGNLLAVRQPQALTVTAPNQVADGQQFVIGNVGFEFDNNNATTVGFHSVAFTSTDTADATGARLAADIAAAINAASNPSSSVYVPGFNVQAQLGPAANQVTLLLQAPASFNFTGALATTQLTLPLNSIPARLLGATSKALSQSQTVLQNKLNGLQIGDPTNVGQASETLDVTARLHSTDITYLVTENLVLTGEPGGALGTVGREAARLQVDPGVVVKLAGAAIEVGPGANLVAEGDQNHQVTFTSMFDNSIGSGGTFFASGGNQSGGAAQASPGDWGGIYFSPTSEGSFDYAGISYGGGPVSGVGQFNAVEINQAQVRIADSTLTNNANGFDTTGTTRGGLGLNNAA
ncbi:MAG: hypothetical protein ACREHD_05205, partial [Pirellulales bacterium]